MNRIAKRMTVILAGVVLVSCAGSTPPRTQYLLRAEPVERSVRVRAPVHVGLGRVVVAPYLHQSGIVVETEASQVRAARQHQWAEPLEAGLRSYLRAEISNALGYEVSADRADRPHWDYAVDVHIDRLHGTMTGTAVIDASYRITPRAASKQATEYRFSRSTSLPRDGYPGLVEAEAGLARELAAAIAASLRDLGGS
ncbi:MAG: ABC-type transport auxiliary lipoprotein family protein [Candidatus Binatia bacterium]